MNRISLDLMQRLLDVDKCLNSADSTITQFNHKTQVWPVEELHFYMSFFELSSL